MAHTPVTRRSATTTVAALVVAALVAVASVLVVTATVPTAAAPAKVRITWAKGAVTAYVGDTVRVAVQARPRARAAGRVVRLQVRQQGARNWVVVSRKKFNRNGRAQLVVPTGRALQGKVRAVVRGAATPARNVRITQRAVDPGTDGDGSVDEVLALINQVRSTGVRCGDVHQPAVPPLSTHPALAAAAQAHAEDMATKNYFSHDSLDGRDPFERMQEAGFSGGAMAENIGAGYPSARDAVAGWLSSPGHCTSLMSPSYTWTGIGYAHNAGSAYKHYWVQGFGG